MSQTTGLFAIRGNHLNALSGIFAAFQLVDTGKDKLLTRWADAEKTINNEYQDPQDHIQYRVVWFDNGWTIIEDLSLILCTDEAALEALSEELDTQIFSLITQGTSACYGFWYFDKTKQRSFFSENGHVTDNSEMPLSQEKKFSINEDVTYNDIHGLAKELGIDWEGASRIQHFVVKELVNSDELNEQIDQFKKNNQQAPEKSTGKPWWKIW